MNPALQAAQVYRSEPSTHTFWEALDFYLAEGFVHSTPDFFVMARPVCSEWPEAVIVDPVACPQTELTGRHDSWHIGLMAGNMKKALPLFPYELPFISLERKNSLKFYDYERFKRSILRH